MIRCVQTPINSIPLFFKTLFMMCIIKRRRSGKAIHLYQSNRYFTALELGPFWQSSSLPQGVLPLLHFLSQFVQSFGAPKFA